MMDYEKFKVKEYKYWSVYVHCEFYYQYLGGVYIWSKREDDVDVMEMSDEEQEELFEIGRNVKKVLNELFQPDRVNYSAHSNVAPHLHMHVIPRYKTPRTFDGIEFLDNEWGGPPKNKTEVEIPEETLLKIRDLIKEKLINEQ